MTQLTLQFEVWKACLRKDCEDNHKVREFDGLGEFVLRLLWQNGLEPSVKAIVDDGESIEKDSKRESNGRMTEAQQRSESWLRELLEEEVDVRMRLLLWLESEILLVRSQIEQMKSQNAYRH